MASIIRKGYTSVEANLLKNSIEDKTLKQNCRNCGANEIKNNNCAYCGTKLK